MKYKYCAAAAYLLPVLTVQGEVQHRRAAEAGPRPRAVDAHRVQAPPDRHAGHVHFQVRRRYVAVRIKSPQGRCATLCGTLCADICSDSR